MRGLINNKNNDKNLAVAKKDAGSGAEAYYVIIIGLTVS